PRRRRRPAARPVGRGASGGGARPRVGGCARPQPSVVGHGHPAEGRHRDGTGRDRLARAQPARQAAAHAEWTVADRRRVSRRRVCPTRPNRQRHCLGGAGGALAAPFPRNPLPAPLDVRPAAERSAVPGAGRRSEMMVGRSDGRTVARIAAAVVSLFVSPTVRLSALQCADGSPPPCRATPHTPRFPPPYSVAVQYFDNLSADTAAAYLSDGLAEALIVRLGRVDRLVVASRTAVQRFRGRPEEDARVRGRTLNVAHLVTGSVRQAGGRIRVTA